MANIRIGNYLSIERIDVIMRQPNFNNLLKILNKQVPERETLFEFFMNDNIYEQLCEQDVLDRSDDLSKYRILIHAFKNAGYDYVSLQGSDFYFPMKHYSKKKSISLNESVMITDEESFEKYLWLNPEDFDYSRLEKLESELPEGMKIIIWAPWGLLENVIGLVGYENLCIMVYENPELVQKIFDEVGSRLLRYYEICIKYNTVGAIIHNDDWGFNTQTMLSPELMRKYIFPWHRKIVEVAHKASKPAILHACGNLEQIMDEIIDDLKYDGKHSFQDNIITVEEAYERWGNRIAILGGIDLDFICRSTPDAIKARCRSLLDKTAGKSGYALGTGNSVPDYVPSENYFAMISTILRP
jgi:uroporphyrinogen decarboxylase